MRPGRRRARPQIGTQRGAVTAELAMGLPVLMAVTLGLVWLLSVGAAQVRVVDAARETARAAARGDLDSSALARGRQVAPPGSSVSVTRADGQVRSEVTGTVPGPGGLFAHLPSPHLHALAVALDESDLVGPDLVGPDLAGPDLAGLGP